MPIWLHSTLQIALTLTLFSCQESPAEKKESPQEKNAHLINMDPEELTYEQLYDRALTLWDVPYEELKCSTKYGKAHVIVSGPEDASPIVLLHGMNSSSSMWYPNIGALAKKYRVYAIDFLLEVNKSQLEGEVQGSLEVVEWYDEVFNCLGLKKFHLIGASRGGWLTMKIAMDKPARINKLVLLSPAQAFIWIPPGKKLLTNVIYSLNPERDDLRNMLQSLSQNVDKIEQLYIDQYYRASTKGGMESNFVEMTPFTSSELASLSMPVLLLIGDNDFINNERSIKKAEKVIPSLESGILKRSGHFLSVDRAGEVNRRMLNFLESN